MSVLLGIQAIIAAGGAVFAFFFLKDYKDNREKDTTGKQWAAYGAVGFGTNFFDTLGIGSFAPTIAISKLFKLIPDKLIPGTLNVGFCLPVAAQAFIFLTIIEVETLTLVTMVGASIVGAVIGVKVLKGLPVKGIRITMGVGLFVAAFLMLLSITGLFPTGGEALGLRGVRLVIAIVGNFILGMVLPLGIGNYAPCMAMVYLLGLDPRVAFPVMMCTGGLVLMTSGIRFAQEGIYNRKYALAITIFGIPAVLIAAFIVRSMPLDVLRWLVLVVIVYTATTMLISAFKAEEKAAT